MQLDLEKICMYCMQDGLSGGKCAYCGNPDLTQQAPVNALPLRTILHGQYLIGSLSDIARAEWFVAAGR